MLAYTLIPKKWDALFTIYDFIANSWSDFWFSSHYFEEHCYENLLSALVGYEKALNTFKKFWSQEPFRISVPRTNQCAERAIKVVEEMHHKCKSDEKLRLRFLLENEK